jgi:membrane-bound lytic murein transglycosylase D
MLSRDEFHRFRLLAFSFILVSSIASADLPSPQPSPALSSWSISIPDQLQKNVDFWIQINSHYTVNQGLVHDSENIHYVYSVLDLSRSKRNTDHLIQVEKAKWKKVLLSVHKKQAHPEKMNLNEKRVFEMFKDSTEPNKFLNAAHRKRLRFQRGQKEAFLSGLYQSGKYLRKMETVFVGAGLPPELTRLPFVESSFNLKARSKVGASGIWQFMKSTGRLFLRVDDVVDERNDPIRASEAAAQLLTLNYRSLGNWPLAVTAYNHGRKGLMRAVRRLGSDQLVDVIDGYGGRSFGFASRNFFPELVALIELEKNASRYFGQIERAPEMLFYEVKLSRETNLPSLIQFLGLSFSEVRELNPGLSDSVFHQGVLVPAGYLLRLKRASDESEEVLTKKFFEKYDLSFKSQQG